MLLQAMSEEKATAFQTEPLTNGVLRIKNIGRDPWLVKELHGTVQFKNPGAADFKIQPLDFNGYPAGQPGSGAEVKLAPGTLYYLVTR